MKKEYRLMKLFGKNEACQANIPRKISGTFVSRIVFGEDMGCDWCFPHGYETVNSHIRNRQRSWKKHRKTKWKTLP